MARSERWAMAVVVAAAVVVGGLTIAAHGNPAATRTVTVLPGETVASVVAEEMPAANFARAVDEVIRLNDLHGTSISAGQVLLLPARD